MAKKKQRSLIRVGKVSVNEVLDLIRDKRIERATLLGEDVAVAGVRLETFAFKGIRCVFCGAEAKFFALEKHHVTDGSYHLNLYGFNRHGKEVLFTRDHIYPKALKGPNILSNMQPACVCCNNGKSHEPMTRMPEYSTIPPEMVEVVYIGEPYFVNGKVAVKAGDKGLIPKEVWELDPELHKMWKEAA